MLEYLRGRQLLWCVHAYWIYMRTSRWQMIKFMIILLSTLEHFQCKFSSLTCAFSVLCLIPAGLLAWPSLHWAPCWHQSAPLQFELCEGVPPCQQHRLLCSHQQPSGLLFKKSNTAIIFNQLKMYIYIYIYLYNFDIYQICQNKTQYWCERVYLIRIKSTL